jgi:hypothetical protein
MTTYIAYLTPADGVPRRLALLSTDIDDAREEARLLGQAIFGGLAFTYSVRPAA